jgi:hypothetical protein
VLKVVVLIGAVEPANCGTWEHPDCAASTPIRLCMIAAPRGRSLSYPKGAGMKRLLERSAALGMHKKEVTVCVRLVGAGGEVEELITQFSTMASQLVALCD